MMERYLWVIKKIKKSSQNLKVKTSYGHAIAL